MQSSNPDRNEVSGAALTPVEAAERLKQIKKGDWQSSRAATRALAELKHPQVVDLLIAALKDEKWHVRYNVAHALAQIGDLRAVEPLGLAYKEWGKWHRSTAAFSLWQLGNPIESACLPGI